VDYCIVSDALTYGINNAGNNSLIEYNTVTNAGNIGLEPDVTPAGIFSMGTGVTIKNNTTSNSGYAGIDFSGASNVVSGNVVDQSMLRLDDGGGIYTYSGSPTNTETGIVISWNSVTNTIGNVTGTTSTSTLTAGIYLDNDRHDVNVSSNTVSNADYDLYIHDGWNNTLSENTAHLARQYGLYVREDVTAGTVHSNSIKSNILESSAKSPAWYYSSTESTVGFGTSNNNLFCHPAVSTVFNNQPTGSSTNYTLSNWQAFSGQDRSSTESSAACPSAQIVSGGTPALN
jgi:parallel beta-helix repeat protein